MKVHKDGLKKKEELIDVYIIIRFVDEEYIQKKMKKNVFSELVKIKINEKFIINIKYIFIKRKKRKWFK